MDNNQFKYYISQNLARINALESMASKIIMTCHVLQGDLNVALGELNLRKHPELNDVTWVPTRNCAICNCLVGYIKGADGLWRQDPTCDCFHPSKDALIAVSEDEVYEQFQKNKKLEEENNG